MTKPNDALHIDKASPAVADVHIDRALTNISVAFMQDDDTFLVEQYFPLVKVSKRSDKYFVYNKGDMLRILAQKRAPSTESAGAGYELKTENYFCEKYALHHDVSDEERDNSDTPLNAFRDATQFVTDNLLMKREKDFLNTIFQPAVWGADVTPAVKWNDANSTPIEDIKGWARDLAKRIAKKRRDIKMIATTDVDDVLKSHPEFVDRVKFTSTQSVSNQLIASLCEIGQYEVTEAMEAPNAKGSTDENDIEYMVAPNQIFLCYVTRRASLKQPTAGYTFSWTGTRSGTFGPTIKRHDIRLKETTRIEGTMNYDMKIVAKDAGTYGSALLS